MMKQPSPRDPIHRPHSNTVSGERPLPPIKTTSHPASARRSSEGSPCPPFELTQPTRELSPPSPDSEESLKTLSLHRHFPTMMALSTSSGTTDDEVLQHKTRNRSSTVSSTSQALPPLSTPPGTAHESTSSVARLFNKKTMTRSRGSSLSNQNGSGNDNEPTTTAGKLLSAAAAAAAAAATSSVIPLAGPTKLRSSGMVNGSDSDTTESFSTTSSSSTTSDAGRTEDSLAPLAVGSIAAACNIELASAKRNQDFHQLFRSVPEEDPLLEDFGCALQKEILLQGRLYISENHLCFNANIFGWVTNLVIAFADIVDIEKRMTALFIPNAIQISTLQAKHFFASFLSRDQAYDLIVDVWRQSRPQKMEINDDLAENDLATSSSEESDLSSESSTFTDIEDDSDRSAIAQNDSREPLLSRATDISKNNDGNNPSRATNGSNGTKVEQNVSTVAAKAGETNGNKDTITTQIHEKTECECLKNGTHFPNVVLDQTYRCTMDALYNLLYHGDFIEKFLAVEKNTDINIGPWEEGQGNVQFMRELSYIKPINGAIGPKQTRCLLKEEIYHKDFHEYVTQLTTTQTPDVPSGGSFTVKTRTCMMWAGQGQIRMIVTVLVDFTKSSWIKSTIENASISGQENYYKALDSALRRSLAKYSQGPVSNGQNKSAKRRKRIRKKKSRDMTKDHGQGRLKVGMMADIGITLTDCFGWVTKHASLPTTTQISLLCMVILVFLNFYMASKMSQVDIELKSLRDVMRNHKQHEQSQAYKLSSPKSSLPNHAEVEEDLWLWLEKLDPEKDPRTVAMDEPHMQHDDVGKQYQEDDTWRIHLKESYLAKDEIDKQMSDLESMIQRAEASMDRVNDVVNQQKRRIRDSWQKKSV
ncbi:hypothetical protein BX666DRAFT_1151055 [Dichotomocladium elegans]|nr:hypothetical protein BX666DRAFT_1151055 [Dichotomocladium elegans]